MSTFRMTSKLGASFLAIALFYDGRIEEMKKQLRSSFMCCRMRDFVAKAPEIHVLQERIPPPSFANNRQNNFRRYVQNFENLLGQSPSEWQTILKSEGWNPAGFDDGVQVYKRPMTGTQLSEFKVLGQFDDITPIQFYRVQMDIEYRKQWDQNVKELCLIGKRGDGDVVLWVHKYPYPFSSRMYLYVRETYVDVQSNTIYFKSTSIKPTDLDKDQMIEFQRISDRNSGSVLVDDYSSEMFVKASKTIHEPGLTYVLRYFDDPKIAVASLAHSWASMSGIVDFMKRMRAASSKFKEKDTND